MSICLIVLIYEQDLLYFCVNMVTEFQLLWNFFQQVQYVKLFKFIISKKQSKINLLLFQKSG